MRVSGDELASGGGVGLVGDSSTYLVLDTSVGGTAGRHDGGGFNGGSGGEELEGRRRRSLHGMRD